MVAATLRHLTSLRLMVCIGKGKLIDHSDDDICHSVAIADGLLEY